jgi:hypothetical protein
LTASLNSTTTVVSGWCTAVPGVTPTTRGPALSMRKLVTNASLASPLVVSPSWFIASPTRSSTCGPTDNV